MSHKLSELCNGGLQERFEKEFAKVLQNIKDPNTSYKDVRKITIEMSIKPDEDRRTLTLSCNVKSRPAPSKQIETNMLIAQDLNTGEIVSKEYGSQIPGQMEFSDLKTDAADGQQENVKKFESRRLSPAMGG